MDIEATAGGCLGRETVRRLSRRSDLQGLLQLALHAGLLCATGLIVWTSRDHPWLLGALVLHGIVLAFLFCPLHESIHRTAFASRWLNDVVAWICGALLMLPPEYFRLFHFAHHRFTQDPMRDPELATPAPATLRAYLWRISGLPYWRDRLSVTSRHAFSGRVPESFVPLEKRAAIVTEARTLWACYLCILGASLYWQRADALVYWVLPALLGQPLLRLFLPAEHWGCDLSDDMLRNTRTTHTSAFVRMLTWRMPFHAEHHVCPSVPFHALPELHALIGPSVPLTAPGYLALHREVLQRLRASGAG